MSILERITALPQEHREQALKELPSFLAATGKVEGIYKLLTTYDFLHAKMSEIGLESLLDDYTLAKNLGGSAENSTLQRIGNALRAGSVRLRQDPEELWNQVKGRTNIALFTDHPRPVPRLDLRSATLGATDPALLHILQGHTGNVTDCALSADGQVALSASADGTLRLWDTTSGSRHN